jgi:hypothetical protein
MFLDVVEEEALDSALVKDDFRKAREADRHVGDAVGAPDKTVFTGVLLKFTLTWPIPSGQRKRRRSLPTYKTTHPKSAKLYHITSSP